MFIELIKQREVIQSKSQYSRLINKKNNCVISGEVSIPRNNLWDLGGGILGLTTIPYGKKGRAPKPILKYDEEKKELKIDGSEGWKACEQTVEHLMAGDYKTDRTEDGKDVFIRVSEEFSEKLKKGEEQHENDHNYADQYLKNICENIISEISGKTIVCEKNEKLEKVKDLIGAAEERPSWLPDLYVGWTMNTLSELYSLSGKYRDDTGRHSTELELITENVPEDRKIYNVIPGENFDVDSPSTESIIKGENI